MSIELKIKIKNLADEARTIRTEERKVHGMDKWKLQHHRKTVVRDAARRSLIAYQAIRGRDWKANALQNPDYMTLAQDAKEVERMIRKYGNDDILARFKSELSGGNSEQNREDACSHAA